MAKAKLIKFWRHMYNYIKNINAYEVLNSRRNPSLEVEVILNTGITGRATRANA